MDVRRWGGRLKSPSTVAAGIVLASVCFGLILTLPSLPGGIPRAGDDIVHLAWEQEASRALALGEGPGSWSELYGFGTPLFLFRPPGFYLAAAGLRAILPEQTPAALVHKLLIALSLALYPACVYFLCRALSFGPLPSAAAAAFSLMPISTWGHTLSAYYDLGLAKQSLAILVFPLSLGAFLLAPERRLFRFLSPLSFAFLLLNHPYMAFHLALLLVPMAAAVLLCRGPAAAARSVLWSAAGVALGAAVAGFYLLPFLRSPEMRPVDPFTAGFRGGFEVVGEGAAQSVRALLGGALFDRARAGDFGTSDWGWRDNAGSGRWPGLTVLALSGLLLSCLRPRSFPRVAAALGFLASLALFLGPDDVPLLRYLPLAEDYQNIHAAHLVDLFACLLVAALLSISFSRSPAPVLRRVLQGTGLLAVSLLLLNAGMERHRAARASVGSMSLDLVGGVLTPAGPNDERSRSYAECARILREDPVAGRVYASPEGPAATRELIYHTLLPHLSGRTDVINGFFAGEAGGASWIVNNVYRKELGTSPVLLAELGIRYVLIDAANEGRFSRGLRGAGRILHRSPSWVLYQFPENHAGWRPCSQKPWLVLANDRQWQEACALWLARRMEAGEGREYPHLLRWRPGLPEAIPDACGGLLVLENDPAILASTGPLAERFRVHGLPLLSVEGGPSIPGARKIVPESWDPTLLSPGAEGGEPTTPVDSPLHPAPPTCESQETGTAPDWIHRASIRCDRPAFFRLPTSYYRGWSGSVDGRAAPLLQMSPGITALFAPAGSRSLAVRYRGPRSGSAGRILSLAGLLGAVAVGLPRRPAFRSRSAGLVRHVPHAAWAARILIVLLPAWLGYQAFRQQVLGIPERIAPEPGARLRTTNLHLEWHPDPRIPVGRAHAYTIELMERGSDGWIPAYRWNRYTPTQIDLAQGLLPGRVYRWRVRTERGQNPGRWSGWRTFSAPAADLFGRTWQDRDPFRLDLSVLPEYRDTIRVVGATNLPPRTVVSLFLHLESGRVREAGAFEVGAGRLDQRLWTPEPVRTVEAVVDLIRQRYPAKAILQDPARLLLTADQDHVEVDPVWFSDRAVAASPDAEADAQAAGADRSSAAPVLLRAPSPATAATADPAGRSVPFVVDRAFRVGSVAWAFGRAGLPDRTPIEVGLWSPLERDPLSTQRVEVQSGHWSCSIPLRTEHFEEMDLRCRAIFDPEAGATPGARPEPPSEAASLAAARIVFHSRPDP